MSRSLFLSLLCLLAACVSQPAKPTEAEATPTPEQRAAACLASGAICEAGLQEVRLGLSMFAFGGEALGADSATEVWEHSGGFEWLVRTYAFDDGRVIVEGSFLDDRYITDEHRNASAVNRIRIETARFRTPAGIGVGSPLAALGAAHPGADFLLTPIPAFGYLDVQPDSSHLHYLLPLPDSLPEPLSIDGLPQTTTIAAVIVM
ncbi:MAG: hypothetical protein OHK0039_18250 [Bacteroidia bacterium]